MRKISTAMGGLAVKCKGSVMAGLVPAIHAAVRIPGSSYSAARRRETRWSFETVVALHGVDARNKSGHDAEGVDQTPRFSALALSLA
jgi:hypothetical protein